MLQCIKRMFKGVLKMKKLIISLITVLMLVSSLSFSSFAENLTKISVDEVEAARGNVVSVPVKISNNQGIWGMVFDVKFDSDVFQVQEVTNNNEVFYSADIMIGPSNFNDGYVRVVVTPSNIYQNNTKNGTICIIKFLVKEDAELTEYPLSVSFEENNMCDIDAKEVKVTSADGSIIVKKTVENVAQKEPEKTTEEVIAKAKDNVLIEETTSADETATTDVGGEKTTKVQNGNKEDSTETVEKIENGKEQYGDESYTTEIILACVIIVLVIVGIVILVISLKKRRK